MEHCDPVAKYMLDQFLTIWFTATVKHNRHLRRVKWKVQTFDISEARTGAHDREAVRDSETVDSSKQDLRSDIWLDRLPVAAWQR